MTNNYDDIFGQKKPNTTNTPSVKINADDIFGGPAPASNAPAQTRAEEIFNNSYKKPDKQDNMGTIEYTLNSLKSSLGKRQEAFSEGVNAYSKGEQSFPETVLQGVGQTLGGAADIAFSPLTPAMRVIGPAVSSVTPDFVKQGLQKAGEGINQFKTENPRASRNIEAGLGAAMALPIPGLKGAEKLATGLKVAQEGIAGVKGKLGNITSNVGSKIAEGTSSLIKGKTEQKIQKGSYGSGSV